MGLLNWLGRQRVAPSHLGDIAVYAKGVGVRYEPAANRDDIQSLVYRSLLRRKTNKAPKAVWALSDVDLVARAGDIVGVIGPNGAGKTTLCRTIAGVLRPDKGSLETKGEVFSLLSLGTGFNQELTGRENILLNGMMMGWSRSELKQLLPEIVAFAELENFIDQPLKTYSAGMKARLGFSVAVMSEPDILIVDEALSVGDVHFSAKAARRMHELVQKAKVVLVVTHSLSFVEQHCTQALWLDAGRVRASGTPREVVAQYRETVPAPKPRVIHSVSFVETRASSGTVPVVEAKGIGVSFPRRRVSRAPGLSGKVEPFWALRDVSFTVYQGDILGVVGRNGAGKTTLTKLLSGILKPDTGSLRVYGETTALLTLGTGFNHQLTGRDNIFLNGMMLGIPRHRLNALLEDIIAFSGLGDSIDRPLKQYSRGMMSRLGFSIAATIQPDIFIVDEALAVGDLSFYERASAKMQELMENAKAVIVVTHDMSFVQKVCTRAIWLDSGRLRMDGAPNEVVAQYTHS